MRLGMIFWGAGLATGIWVLALFFGMWAMPALLAYVPYFWMASRVDCSSREEIGGGRER